jgi:hypothetical protein
MKTALWVAISLSCAAGGMAADFDGDGVADEFKPTRDAGALAVGKDVRLVDPWNEKFAARQTPKGLCLFVRLSRKPQSYLVHGPVFSTPMWSQKPLPMKIIGTKDRAYVAWKKVAPEMKGDGIQLGTEAGIDIMLYWNGKRWRVFEPDEEP